ncbi:MAG: response regulator [Gammaproteobacteria bacterium]|nr:response regulator [Gammaproteobacteria bacterium]
MTDDKARILFVDDEKRVLNSMRGLFRREFELYLTTEGATAVKIAAEKDIDVIVADQRMPGMTGIEVLGKVKELSPRTVRLLLTGYADQDAVEGSINIGEVFRYLSKPCPPRTLRKSLQLAVEAARASVPELNENRNDITPEPRPIATMPPAANSPNAAPKPSGPPAASPAAAVPPVYLPPPKQPRETPTTSPWDSITDVVLSGDSSKETHPADASLQTLAMTKNVGVVVFTIDPNFAETAIRAVSNDRDTILATTLSKVASAIESRQAGVLVTDFTNKGAVLQKIISVLKQYLPELVTIVANDGRDTTDMISLINYGQIFRYLVKPIDSRSLRNEISAAAIKHMQLQNNPELSKRHRVRNITKAADSSATVSEFVGRIRSLPVRGEDEPG